MYFKTPEEKETSYQYSKGCYEAKINEKNYSPFVKKVSATHIDGSIKMHIKYNRKQYYYTTKSVRYWNGNQISLFNLLRASRVMGPLLLVTGHQKDSTICLRAR